MNLKRRDFVKIGGITAAGSIILPGFLQSCNGISLSDNAESYMSHFEVDQKLLNKVISAAMEKGADYADLFFEHTLTNNTALEDNKVNSAYSNIAYGVGIRVLKGDQTGYAFSEIVDQESMLKAARTAANIASLTAKPMSVDVHEYTPPSYYAVKNSWEETSVKDKIPFMQRLNDKITSGDKRVTRVNVFLGDSTSYILFYNSEGLLTWDYRPMVYIGGVCIMEENGRIENYTTSRAFRMGAEFLTNEMIDELAAEALEKTPILFTAGKPKAGEMEIVMAPGGSGILLHEAMGHSFEADFNRKSLSIFSDKLGKKIAENFVTIKDDGTLPGLRGSINFDDDGNQSLCTTLVENGTLTSYLHDRISANHYKCEPTGNGRRQDFRSIPIPRMRSTYMDNGPHKKEEIIASVKNGIYVESFSNGQVNIGPGDFTFFVKLGYLIENGKLTKPIKDVNIIGNGPQALADITMVGDDMKMDQGIWTCGKGGQNAPVSMGIPTVKIKKLTVGGVS
jgi:TldD protein